MSSMQEENKVSRDYINFQTKNSEMKYKTYKNKLTAILKKAKKDHHNTKLK